MVQCNNLIGWEVQKTAVTSCIVSLILYCRYHFYVQFCILNRWEQFPVLMYLMQTWWGLSTLSDSPSTTPSFTFKQSPVQIEGSSTTSSRSRAAKLIVKNFGPQWVWSRVIISHLVMPQQHFSQSLLISIAEMIFRPSVSHLSLLKGKN